MEMNHQNFRILNQKSGPSPIYICYPDYSAAPQRFHEVREEEISCRRKEEARQVGREGG